MSHATPTFGRYDALAAWLLAGGVAAHFVWRLASTDLQGQAWNASGAAQTLVLLALVANAYRARPVLWVCGLLGAWQLMVAGCSLAYMAAPWPIAPGQAQCSAALDMPLGLASLWVASLLAARLWR